MKVRVTYRYTLIETRTADVFAADADDARAIVEAGDFDQNVLTVVDTECEGIEAIDTQVLV